MKCNKKCESKDRKKLAEYDMSTGLCIYCNKDVEEGVECGKLLTDKNRELFVHKYCLLFASGLPQAGADNEGIEGFLVEDILREYRRSRKLNCSYCHKKTATIGCSLSVCRRGFHFNCGVKNEALFCFFDTFLAYCQHHRAQQDVQVSESDPATVTCPICFEDVEARVSNHTLKTPCCTNTWFHRNCIQRQALSAGYFFRCAICNNQELFQIEMKKFGIYIPEHDASWEMEDNAFQELYWRHDKCDFDPCACPEGRQFNKASSKWELLLCDLCGSSGCHLACGGLKSVNQDWACAMCNAMMSNATEVSCPSSASPQKSPSQGGDSPSKTGQTTRTAMKLMGKHPRTPLSSHTFRKKTATPPFSSLKLPNSPDEIADSFLDNRVNVRKSSFKPPDLVVSFEHCQPSTSKQGLEDADCKHTNGKKRKLSHCSKENDLNHYAWKIQAADQLNNKMSPSSSSGLIYGPRTTLRMSMRPRKIALLQCSHDSTGFHRVSSVLPPDHPENSFQQTVDSMGGKSNLTRPESTETLIKGQVKVESGDPSPKVFSYDVSEYSSGTSEVTDIKYPKKASSKLEKKKSFAHRYASFGQRWKKRLAQSRRQSASLGDETKSQFLAVHTDNPRTGKEDENGANYLLLAKAEVPTIRKSPLYPENDSSLEESSANVSGCSSTLFDLTDCAFALPSGSENVIKPQEQHHVRADLQDDDVLVQSADTTLCPSPHFSRHCASPLKQSSPCEQTSHCPYYTSPDHWVSSVLPPDHPENSFQQTVNSIGGKSNLTRPDSIEIKGQVKVNSGDPSSKRFSYADDIKELKPELLSVPLPQISTFQTVDYLQRASMPIKLPESVEPENGQSHLVSTQGSISKTYKCPSSEVQQLINGDAICRDINIGCQANYQLERKEAYRSHKSKKQKSSKLTSKYPVIGTGKYATLHSQNIKRKLQRKATSSKCGRPQRKHAKGTCQLRLCQNDRKKPESQGEVRLSTGMLLRRRVSLNKESVPSHNTENAGRKSAWPSITVQESSCTNLTDNSRVEVLSSSECNTIPTTPSNNFQAVGNQFEIRECRNSCWVDSFSAQGRYCGSEIQGATQSTGKLLRRKYIRDHAETSQDSSSCEEGRGIERERPGPPVSGNQTRETAQSPNGSQSGTTESNTMHNETISTLPGNKTGDNIAMEELASKSETLSETSPDSGISQGFVCNQEETPPGKPCLTPTMINRSALVNLEEIHSEEKSDQPFALAQSRKGPPNTPGSDASNDMIPGCKNITIKIDASDDDLEEIATESKEKSFQPFALAQSRNSSPNTPGSDASNVIIPESKIITIENDASVDDVIPMESTCLEPVKTKSVLNGPVSERSQTTSPTAIVRRSSCTPKGTESPPTVGSDSKCSPSDIPQSSGDSIPNPNPEMKMNSQLLLQTSISTVMPGTPPIKPTQMERSLTFSGRDGGCSPRLRDTSNKPMSCPGKCQSGQDSEILEKSHRLLRKRQGQNLSSRVCANLFKVREDQGRPLKRPRIDILARPVSPLVSGNDVLFTPRNNKTTIYVSNLSKTTSQKEMVEADSPKSRQAGSSSGGGIPEQCLADCQYLKMSTSHGLLTLTAESPQRPWLLRSQTQKGRNVCSVESASPLPSRGSANVRQKAKVYLPNSIKVGPSRKPTQDSSCSMPQENCNPQPDGGPLGTNPGSSLTPKADSHQEEIASRPLLLRSRSKKEAKSSASPLCSPLPSSPCSSSPKPPRIYCSLPPRSTSNQHCRQKGNASSAPMLEKKNRCPTIKPCSAENLCPPSLSPVFLPNLSSGRRCSTGPPKLSRQEDLTNKSSKGCVQLFKS